MKLHAELQAGDSLKTVSKSSNGEIHIKLFIKNSYLYHLKLNEYGMLTAYVLHETDEPDIYNHSILWSEYQAHGEKQRKAQRKA
jgi:hypothetical protein